LTPVRIWAGLFFVPSFFIPKRYGVFSIDWKKIIVLDHVVDNNEIFSLTDVFIGSGGTMTAEAALRGIPTISYNAIPNIVENYLVKKGLVKREVNPDKIVLLIRKLLNTNRDLIKKKAKSELKTMEDPYFKLVKTIESITQ